MSKSGFFEFCKKIVSIVTDTEMIVAFPLLFANISMTTTYHI